MKKNDPAAMIPLDSGGKEVYLLPAEIYIATRPTVITTVLGSCVSITMFSPKHRIGGICHGLLPYCTESHDDVCSRSFLECFRNVECSVKLMVERFQSMGIRRGELDVRMFGGGRVLGVNQGDRDRLTVGDRNIEAAKRAVAQEGLRLVEVEVGGMKSRKIRFYSDSGRVEKLPMGRR